MKLYEPGPRQLAFLHCNASLQTSLFHTQRRSIGNGTARAHPLPQQDGATFPMPESVDGSMRYSKWRRNDVIPRSSSCMDLHFLHLQVQIRRRTRSGIRQHQHTRCGRRQPETKTQPKDSPGPRSLEKGASLCPNNTQVARHRCNG